MAANAEVAKSAGVAATLTGQNGDLFFVQRPAFAVFAGWAVGVVRDTERSSV